MSSSLLDLKMKISSYVLLAWSTIYAEFLVRSNTEILRYTLRSINCFTYELTVFEMRSVLKASKCPLTHCRIILKILVP